MIEIKKIGKKPRGFACISPERVREIAAMGGRAVPKEHRSFSRNKELAILAGSKGGKAVTSENRTFARSAEIASRAGRKGGAATAFKYKKKFG